MEDAKPQFTVKDEMTIESRPVYNQDEADIAEYGKKQALKRRFGILPIVGLSCTLMITWEVIPILLGQGLANGGPEGLITSFIFAFVGCFSQTLVMAEMGSMIPLTGGQYNWVAVLAPPSCSKFLSYLVGWMTAAAWQALIASGVYLAGAIVQGMVILQHPEYMPKQYQTTLIFYAIIAVVVVANTLLARFLPLIETGMLYVHICGFIAVLIPLCYFGEKVSARDVFQVFLQEGGWSSKGLTFFVGMNNMLLTFIGNDGAAHVAEEIDGAKRVIPQAMLIAVLINGFLGLAMLIVLLFSLTDVEGALGSPTGFPFMEIFRTTLGSNGGAVAMTFVIVFICLCAMVGIMAAGSRMLWAFARERGVPGHRWIGKVHRKSSLPLASIGVTLVINMILALINIGSTTAFYAFTSITVSGVYMSYMIAASCLLWAKLTKKPLKYGSFRLGKAGIPVIVFSLCYSFLGAFFSFWPQFIDPTPKLMNYASAIFGGTMIVSLIYWVLVARKSYTGPIVEITLEEYHRETHTE